MNLRKNDGLDSITPTGRASAPRFSAKKVKRAVAAGKWKKILSELESLDAEVQGGLEAEERLRETNACLHRRAQAAESKSLPEAVAKELARLRELKSRLHDQEANLPKSIRVHLSYMPIREASKVPNYRPCDKDLQILPGADDVYVSSSGEVVITGKLAKGKEHGALDCLKMGCADRAYANPAAPHVLLRNSKARSPRLFDCLKKYGFDQKAKTGGSLNVPFSVEDVRHLAAALYGYCAYCGEPSARPCGSCATPICFDCARKNFVGIDTASFYYACPQCKVATSEVASAPKPKCKVCKSDTTQKCINCGLPVCKNCFSTTLIEKQPICAGCDSGFRP